MTHFVPAKYIKLTETAKEPVLGSPLATGYDVHSDEDVDLRPGEYRAVGTGLSLDLSMTPLGTDVQVRPRSGLAAKHGVTVLNAPGTIDRDYQGELKVILINHGKLTYRISKGDRIAQLVFAQYFSSTAFFPTKEHALSTERGDGGFGSTGV